MRAVVPFTPGRGLVLAAGVLVGSFLLPWPALGATAPAGAHAGVTFAVNSTADSHDAHPGDGRCADSAGRCTLRAAVEAADAEPAGTPVSVDVPAGQYVLTLGSLSLTANSISVTGAGPAASIVRAKGAFRVVNVGPAATATLSLLTITGGRAGQTGYGGGVFSAGTLTISQCVISGNKATAGGGVANAGGTLTVTHSTVTGRPPAPRPGCSSRSRAPS